MSWYAPTRCAQWLFVLILAASSVGCPELNQWSGPGYQQDPFMNVADDVDEPVAAPQRNGLAHQADLSSHWYDTAAEEARTTLKSDSLR